MQNIGKERKDGEAGGMTESLYPGALIKPWGFFFFII